MLFGVENGLKRREEKIDERNKKNLKV